MKKHLVILFLTLASWSMATPAYADQQFVPLATIPGLNDNVSPTSAGIAIFLNNLYTFAIGIAVILAIAMIIWGGLEYSLSEAITSKSAGRKRITQALFGLVLVLSPVVVFTIINPKILSLNVNFPALNTQFGDYAQGGYGTQSDCSTGTCLNSSTPTICRESNNFCASDIQNCNDVKNCTRADASTYTPQNGKCANGESFACAYAVFQ